MWGLREAYELVGVGGRVVGVGADLPQPAGDVPGPAAVLSHFVHCRSLMRPAEEAFTTAAAERLAYGILGGNAARLHRL